MSRPDAARAWPFPGLVWGDYPEHPPHDPAPPAPRPLGRRKLRLFIDAADAAPLLSAEPLAQRLHAIKQRSTEGDDWLAEAFSLARSALALALGFTPHRQQLLAARILLDNR
ncbi:MAG: hypothetical protein H7242_00500, partial [Microbacteriaceae bacterium]|nr:hypothetical protein [Burkholderiaceae bacterium]